METHFPPFYIEHLNTCYPCSQLWNCVEGDLLRERMFELWKYGSEREVARVYKLNRD